MRLAGRQITAIAYPNGKMDAWVAAAVYLARFTLRYEAAAPESDPLLLGRIEPPYFSVGRFTLRLLRTLGRP